MIAKLWRILVYASTYMGMVELHIYIMKIKLNPTSAYMAGPVLQIHVHVYISTMVGNQKYCIRNLDGSDLLAWLWRA